MATLGQQLKTAREAKGVTEEEAGSATKTLSKIIRAMEADDFSIMPAPTYAKGFIRLYAEYLGLDSEPLVEEYLSNHASAPRPFANPSSQLQKNSRKSKPTAVNLQKFFAPLPRIALPKKMTALFSNGWNALPGSTWKDVRVLAGAITALLVLLILITSISNCAHRRTAKKPETPTPQLAPSRMLLDEPVPDLYLVEPGKIETN